MYLFSGNCCLCRCGDATGVVDMEGNSVFVGDVVQLWHGNYIGTDFEEWYPTTGLTAVVRNEYRTWSGNKYQIGENKEPDAMEPFTMGIKTNGISGGEWAIKVIKSFSDIVNGEKMKAFGFRYFFELPESHEFLPPAGSP